jgi:hypothetical protein
VVDDPRAVPRRRPTPCPTAASSAATAPRSRPAAATTTCSARATPSDTGSDIQGATRLKTEPEEGELGGATPVVADSDTDAEGTGERAEAVPEGARDGADIGPDRIARSKDALDSAESITGNDDSIESLADESSDEDEEEEL